MHSVMPVPGLRRPSPIILKKVTKLDEFAEFEKYSQSLARRIRGWCGKNCVDLFFEPVYFDPAACLVVPRGNGLKDSAVSPASVVKTLFGQRALIAQLVRREITGRYRGSFLGVFWSLFNPLLMLAIYTFVFGVVFKSRWRPASTDPMEFAVVMFAGVMLHTFIAECITRAPGLIVGNANFVKKVIFPLDAFAWVAVGSALFHMLIAMLIFVAAIFVWQGHVLPSVLLVPVLIMPFALMVVGFVWFISSLGVYLRDIGQLMGIVASLLMFLAPVFYPLQSVPARLAGYLYLNPITFIVEQVRNVAIWGQPVNWLGWAAYCVVAYLVAWFGLMWFQRMRGGFADVL